MFGTEVYWLLCLVFVISLQPTLTLVIEVLPRPSDSHRTNLSASGYNRTMSDTDDFSRFFLLLDGIARNIPNNYTLQRLNINTKILQIPWRLYDDLKHGDPLPSLIPAKGFEWNPDEVMRIEIARINALQDQWKFKSMHKIGYGSINNPSIIRSMNQTVMVNVDASSHLQFFLVNSENFKVERKLNKIGSESHIAQDPRIIHIGGNNYLLAYTSANDRPTRMAFANVSFYLENFTVAIHASHTLNPTVDPHANHKNWSPFLHNFPEERIVSPPLTRGINLNMTDVYKHLLFIQTINPLHIVRLVEYNRDSLFLTAETVSMQPAVELKWEYGHVRGGSPPIKIGNQYIGFFHSRHYINGNSNLHTYFFGAFSFSEDLPFRLLSITPYPIAPSHLYTGPWNPYHNRGLDYVLFPMSAFVEDEMVYLTFGYNDCEGVVVSIVISDLLNHLKPV